MRLRIISKRQAGYSAIEALSVLIIVGILLAIGVVSYEQTRRRVNIGVNAQEVAGFLERARTLSLVKYGGKRYGVHFDADQYVLFEGPAYNASAPTNDVRPLARYRFANPSVFASGSGLGPDVLFTPLSGGTTNTGTIRLESTADPGIFRLITINGIGIPSIK